MKTATTRFHSPGKSPLIDPPIVNGIHHSIVHWCLQLSPENWTLDQTCRAAKKLGVKSVELLIPDQLPTLEDYGLNCGLVQLDTGTAPPFLRGFNNPENWPTLIELTQKTIDAAAAFGAPNVICFTGYEQTDPLDPDSRRIDPEEGAKNCIEGLKKVIGYAEKKQITLCMEHLNTRDDSHPMKGHPGYQGDHVDYCVEILKAVDSPRMKLLFDVYHAQIMDGDIIRRLRQHKEYIGHVHIAGCPGRNEPDELQEINYPAVMRTLLETGYTGYVGQEFLPTRDVFQGLQEAITLCDLSLSAAG